MSARARQAPTGTCLWLRLSVRARARARACVCVCVLLVLVRNHDPLVLFASPLSLSLSPPLSLFQAILDDITRVYVAALPVRKSHISNTAPRTDYDAGAKGLEQGGGDRDCLQVLF